MYVNYVLERGNDVHAYAYTILDTQVERTVGTYEYPVENAWVSLVWYLPKLYISGSIENHEIIDSFNSAQIQTFCLMIEVCYKLCAALKSIVFLFSCLTTLIVTCQPGCD